MSALGQERRDAQKQKADAPREGGGKELHYEVLLFSGDVAELWLPRVLTRADAERVTAFIDALVVEGKEAS
jgi:hypothetical protein